MSTRNANQLGSTSEVPSRDLRHATPATILSLIFPADQAAHFPRDPRSPSHPDPVISHTARQHAIISGRGRLLLYGADLSDLETARRNPMVNDVDYAHVSDAGMCYALTGADRFKARFCKSLEGAADGYYDTIALGFSAARFFDEFESLCGTLKFFLTKLSQAGKLSFLLIHTNLELSTSKMKTDLRTIRKGYVCNTFFSNPSTPYSYYEIPLSDVFLFAESNDCHIEVSPSREFSAEGTTDYVSLVTISRGRYVGRRDVTEEIVSIGSCFSPPVTVGAGPVLAQVVSQKNPGPVTDNNNVSLPVVVQALEQKQDLGVDELISNSLPPIDPDAHYNPSTRTYHIDTCPPPPIFEQGREAKFFLSSLGDSPPKEELIDSGRRYFEQRLFDPTPPDSVNRSLIKDGSFVNSWQMLRDLSGDEATEFLDVDRLHNPSILQFNDRTTHPVTGVNFSRLLAASAPYRHHGILYYLPRARKNCLLIDGQSPVIITCLGNNKPQYIKMTVAVHVSVRIFDKDRGKPYYRLVAIDCTYPSGLLGRASYIRHCIPMNRVDWLPLRLFLERYPFGKHGIIFADAGAGHFVGPGNTVITHVPSSPLRAVLPQDVDWGIPANALRRSFSDDDLLYVDCDGVVDSTTCQLHYESLTGPKAEDLINGTFEVLKEFSRTTHFGLGPFDQFIAPVQPFNPDYFRVSVGDDVADKDETNHLLRWTYPLPIDTSGVLSREGAARVYSHRTTLLGPSWFDDYHVRTWRYIAVEGNKARARHNLYHSSTPKKAASESVKHDPPE